jgi:hypothetical protein
MELLKPDFVDPNSYSRSMSTDGGDQLIGEMNTQQRPPSEKMERDNVDQ